MTRPSFWEMREKWTVLDGDDRDGNSDDGDASVTCIILLRLSLKYGWTDLWDVRGGIFCFLKPFQVLLSPPVSDACPWKVLISVASSFLTVT